MPRPLNPGGLFSPALVKLFEEVERWILALRHSSQDLAKMDYGSKPNPLIDAEDKQLPHLRDLLSRQYLRIGFLGGSQAGKSRTLNNFIGRKVVPVGELRSCTSTRIRLRTTQGPGRIVLRFMTYDSYRQRRDDVGADLLKLYSREDAHTISDERVLKLLDDALASNRFGEGDRDVADFLSRILRSGNRFPDVLSKKGHEPITEVVPNDFERFDELEEVLAKIAKHPEDSDVRKESLLEEIDVCHRDIPVPARLELLDMPGLNTTQGQDEAYTLRAAAELDGALIAMNLGGNLKDPGTYKLTTLLAKRFPDLAQRIWIVATKVDTVPKDLLHGKAGNNLIDSLGRELSRHKIATDRVMLISNEYRDEIFNKLPKEMAIRTLKLDLKADGSPRLPDAIDANPDFRHAFECLAEDGGFGRLIRTVNTQVAEAVLEQVNADVIRRLDLLLSSIEKQLKDAEYVSSMGKSGRAVARAWRKEFERILDKSTGPDDTLVEVGRTLLSSLRRELEEATSGVPANADGQRIIQVVSNLQSDLTECAEAIFKDQGPVFDYLGSVAEKVAQATKDLAKPKLLDPIGDLRTRLQVIDSRWLQRLRADIISLKDPVLVGRDGKTSLTLKDVVSLFKAKIQQVSRQTIFRIDSLVKWHLQEVSSQLGRISVEESDTQGSVEDYKNYLAQVQRFKASLSALGGAPFASATEGTIEVVASTPANVMASTGAVVISPLAAAANEASKNRAVGAASAASATPAVTKPTSEPKVAAPAAVKPTVPKKPVARAVPKPPPAPTQNSNDEPGASEEW